VRKLWQACDRNGDIYTRRYRGLYCVGCEQFYAEDELDNGRCPEHQTRPELVEEENYFFRLSRYAGRLIDEWELAKRQAADPTARNELHTVLYNLIEALRLLASVTAPFLPSTAATIFVQLGIEHLADLKLPAAGRWGVYPAGTVVQPAGVLFPKRERADTRATSHG